MNLLLRPGLPADLPAALECLRDGFLYHTPARRKRLLTLWQDIVSRCGPPYYVVEDLSETFGHRLVAFGMGVFIHDWFYERLFQDDYAYMADLFLDPDIQARTPFLTEAEVARHNAGAGVILLAIHSGAPERVMSSPDGLPIVDQAARLNYLATAGYRLRDYLIEVYGEGGLGRQWAENMGGHVVREGQLPGGMLPEHRPYLVSARQEDNPSPGSPVAMSFRYQPPRCGFSPAEQELLSWALSGLTDTELADRLCVTKAAVRKRWESVYERASLTGVLPAEEGTDKAASARAAQKKRRLLNYLQYHVEELRPYAPADAKGHS